MATADKKIFREVFDRMVDTIVASYDKDRSAELLAEMPEGMRQIFNKEDVEAQVIAGVSQGIRDMILLELAPDVRAAEERQKTNSLPPSVLDPDHPVEEQK